MLLYLYISWYDLIFSLDNHSCWLIIIFLKISFILSLLKDKFEHYYIIKKTFNSFFISHKRQISRFLKSLNVAEIKSRKLD
jgi:hypothetical protein